MQYYCHNCKKIFSEQFPIVVQTGDAIRCPMCLQLSKIEVIKENDNEIKRDKEHED